MKRILERMFCSIYLGYKQSENEDVPITSAVTVMVLMEMGICFLMMKLFDLKYHTLKGHYKFVALSILGILFIVNFIYFKEKRVKNIEEDFKKLSPVIRNLFAFSTICILIGSIVLALIL